MSNFTNPSSSSASTRSRLKDTQAKDDSFISTKRNIDSRQVRVPRKEDTKQKLDISSAVQDTNYDATGAPLTSSTIGAVSADGVTVGESDFSSSSSSSTKRHSSVRFCASPIGSCSSSGKANNATNSLKELPKSAQAPSQPQLDRDGSTDSMRSIVRSAAKRLHDLDKEEEVRDSDQNEVGYYDEGCDDFEGGFESSASNSPHESKRAKHGDT